MAEIATSIGTSILMEVGATVGVRRAMKLIDPLKRNILSRIENRVTVTQPSNSVSLMAGLSHKPIYFRIDINNPTPFEIKISECSVAIFYKDVQVVRKSQPSTDSKLNITKETNNHPLWLVYEPLSSSLHIPSGMDGWRLKGEILFECFYGRFTKTIDFTAKYDGKQEWSAARASLEAYLGDNK